MRVLLVPSVMARIFSGFKLFQSSTPGRPPRGAEPGAVGRRDPTSFGSPPQDGGEPPPEGIGALWDQPATPLYEPVMNWRLVPSEYWLAGAISWLLFTSEAQE